MDNTRTLNSKSCWGCQCAQERLLAEGKLPVLLQGDGLPATLQDMVFHPSGVLEEGRFAWYSHGRRYQLQYDGDDVHDWIVTNGLGDSRWEDCNDDPYSFATTPAPGSGLLPNGETEWSIARFYDKKGEEKKEITRTACFAVEHGSVGETQNRVTLQLGEEVRVLRAWFVFDCCCYAQIL